MKTIAWMTLCLFLMTSGCAYETAYRDYSLAQANMAAAAGPMVSFHPETGKLISVGNPMIAMAMMNMKEPKDGWTQFFDWLKYATPFAALYGVVGAMSTNLGAGNTTNVQGNSNLVGNTAGPAGSASSWASPVTTTTTETAITGGTGSIGE